MRITGGQAKGRRLSPFKGVTIRPTADHIRETIFNIIGQDLQGRIVLDLFAGTGSLGLEALSRGAKNALFIDASPKAVQLIKKNLAICGFAPMGSVLRRDLKKGLPWEHPLIKERVDLVFLDPPYGRNAVPPLIEALSVENGLLSPALVIAETGKDEDLPISFGNLQRVDARVYGDTRISFFVYEEK